MRVLIANQLVFNAGDAAIGLGVGHQIREALGPEVEITYADTHPLGAAELYPELRFRPQLHRRFLGSGRGRLNLILRLANVARFVLAARYPRTRAVLLRSGERRELEDHEQYDLVIATGGTYLVEHYDFWPRLAELRVITALGIPTVLFTQSLGPFARRSSRVWVRGAVAAASSTLLRDELSLKHLTDIGASVHRARVASDAAFALPAPSPIASATRPARAVVSVREWGDGETRDRYELAMAAALEFLVAQGLEVVLASTCQGIEGYRDDSEVAMRVAARLSETVRASIVLDRRYRRPEELQELLQGAAVALCTRMHMAILSLTVETPVVAIAYEFKARELFARLDMADRVLDFDAITPADLTDRLQRVLDDRTLPAAVSNAQVGLGVSRAALRRAVGLAEA